MSANRFLLVCSFSAVFFHSVFLLLFFSRSHLTSLSLHLWPSLKDFLSVTKLVKRLCATWESSVKEPRHVLFHMGSDKKIVLWPIHVLQSQGPRLHLLLSVSVAAGRENVDTMLHRMCCTMHSCKEIFALEN